MENTLKTLEIEGLSIKLTDEKIFINTATSMETFALRSIDGIGVVDSVEALNIALKAYKDLKTTYISFIVTGVVLCFFGFIIMNFLPIMAAIFAVAGLSVSLFFVFVVSGLTKPTLKSSVRIMMAGGNRDFMFDKAHSNSMEVAEFVAKVEDTLTAFHKK